MGLKIAHFPTAKTLDDVELKFQPSVPLVRELATARFLAQAEKRPDLRHAWCRQPFSRIALGRAVVEAGHSAIFTSATAV